jgi:plastocyanin
MKSTLLLGLLPFSLAQYGGGGATTSSSSSSAASSTSTGSSSIQTIAVGQSGLTFSPNSVNVAAGGSVVFQFFPGGHSATEGQFDTPCAPSNGTGFFSGFVQSSSGPAVSHLSF